MVNLDDSNFGDIVITFHPSLFQLSLQLVLNDIGRKINAPTVVEQFNFYLYVSINVLLCLRASSILMVPV